MKPLTPHQRELLVRKVSRELAYQHATQADRERWRYMADRLIDALAWTGVHGASEKRAVELIVAKIEEAAS